MNIPNNSTRPVKRDVISARVLYILPIPMPVPSPAQITTRTLARIPARIPVNTPARTPARIAFPSHPALYINEPFLKTPQPL